MALAAAIVGAKRPSQSITWTDEDGNAFDPVSYTHLRAHETVLDLVCRLLLEKKKHRTSTTHEDNIR